MTLATKVDSETMLHAPKTHNRHSDEGAADTDITVTPPAGVIRRILSVTVKYSAVVTKNVTVTLNSGAGPNWDTLIKTIALSNATDGEWIVPGEWIISDDDVIDVLAPAGGGVITAAVVVYSMEP